MACLPSCVFEICSAGCCCACATASFPPDYDTRYKQYAAQGARVIALAYRRLGREQVGGLWCLAQHLHGMSQCDVKINPVLLGSACQSRYDQPQESLTYCDSLCYGVILTNKPLAAMDHPSPLGC
jgi:hypothetical protein